MEKQMKTPKIPQTDSIGKLAKFWDTQDVTDFEDELEEVTDPIFDHSTETVLTVSLPSQEADQLKKLASAQGLKDSVLLREWIVEKLQNS